MNGRYLGWHSRVSLALSAVGCSTGAFGCSSPAVYRFVDREVRIERVVEQEQLDWLMDHCYPVDSTGPLVYTSDAALRRRTRASFVNYFAVLVDDPMGDGGIAFACPSNPPWEREDLKNLRALWDPQKTPCVSDKVAVKYRMRLLNHSPEEAAVEGAGAVEVPIAAESVEPLSCAPDCVREAVKRLDGATSSDPIVTQCRASTLDKKTWIELKVEEVGGRALLEQHYGAPPRAPEKGKK